MKGFHEFSLYEVTRWSQMGRAGRRAYSTGVDAMLQVLRGEMTKEEFKELMGRDFDSMMKDPQYAKAVKAKMKKEEVEIQEATSAKEMGFKKWDGNLPSFRVGRLEGVSVNQLVKALGRPHYEDSENDQTTMEWGFINSGGLVFTLYDYDNPPKSKSAPHNWSVGSTSEKHSATIQQTLKKMGVPGKMITEETEITEVFKSGGGVEYYALIVGGKVVAKSTSSKKLRKLADEKYGGYTGYLPKDKSKPKVFVANWPSAKVGDTWKEVKEDTEYVNEGFRMQDWERMSKQHKSPEPVRIITKDRKTVDGRLKRFQYYDQGYATKGYYIILHPRKKGGEEVQIDDVDVMNIYWGDDAIRQRVLDVKEETGGETKGKKLNKPFRTPGEKKKFAVYVKNDSGNVVKVRFGDPNMEIRRDDPDRLKAFRSRHSCDDAPGPKWKARYWSCQMWRSDKGVSDIISEAQDNEPTDPGLWSQAIAKAKSKFDVYPSAYANAWAAKWYKSQGGGWKKATKEETEKSKEKAMNEEKLDEAVRAIIENSFLRRLDEEAEVLEEGVELLEECEEYDLSEMTDSEYNTLVESLMESGADFIIEEDGSLVVEEEQMDEGMKRTIRVRAGKIKRGKTAGRKGYRINKKGRVVKVPAAVLRRKKMKLKRAARRLKGKRSMIARKAKRSKRIGKRLKNRPQNR